MSDPFSFARTAAADAEILDLFRQWQAARAAADAVKDRDCDPEEEIATALAERIFAAPIASAAGLAVKAFMLAHEVALGLNCAGRRWQQPGEIGRIPACQYASRYDWRTRSWAGDASLYLTPRSMIGALNAAVQFCPELAPLAAGAINSPLTIPLPGEDV